jgi:hypothetical protein
MPETDPTPFDGSLDSRDTEARAAYCRWAQAMVPGGRHPENPHYLDYLAYRWQQGHYAEDGGPVVEPLPVEQD